MKKLLSITATLSVLGATTTHGMSRFARILRPAVAATVVMGTAQTMHATGPEKSQKPAPSTNPFCDCYECYATIVYEITEQPKKPTPFMQDSDYRDEILIKPLPRLTIEEENAFLDGWKSSQWQELPKDLIKKNPLYDYTYHYPIFGPKVTMGSIKTFTEDPSDNIDNFETCRKSATTNHANHDCIFRFAKSYGQTWKTMTALQNRAGDRIFPEDYSPRHEIEAQKDAMVRMACALQSEAK